MRRLPCRAVIFDLDGTLLDSVEDMHVAMNEALAHLGLPQHSLDAFRGMVGEGVEVLAARALPPERPVPIELLVKTYRAAYEATRYVRTFPYSGVVELLTALRRVGVPLAVLSNKRDDFTRDLVTLRFAPATFAIVRGHRAGAPLKPDPFAALEIARELGVAPSETAFVGDTAIDMRTAVAAGMAPVGVTWGFRGIDELKAAGAAYLAHTPRELWRAGSPLYREGQDGDRSG